MDVELPNHSCHEEEQIVVFLIHAINKITTLCFMKMKSFINEIGSNSSSSCLLLQAGCNIACISYHNKLSIVKFR